MQCIRAALSILLVVASPGTAAADDAALCAHGLALDRAGDGARAFPYLDRCVAADDAPADARRARDRRRRELDAGDLGVVVVSSKPAGAIVGLELLAGGPPLAAPLTLYLPPGRHRLTATAPGHAAAARDVEVTARTRQVVLLELAAEGPPQAGEVSFEDEGPAVGTVETAPDLRPKKRPTLLPQRYQGPDAAPAPAGAALVDPLPRDEVRPSPRVWPWFVTGGGLALVATGAALALSDHDAAGWIAIGVGGATTGAGAWLLLDDGRRPR